MSDTLRERDVGSLWQQHSLSYLRQDKSSCTSIFLFNIPAHDNVFEAVFCKLILFIFSPFVMASHFLAKVARRDEDAASCHLR
jgi:hypothetical protein